MLIFPAHCIPPEEALYLDTYMGLRNGSTDYDSGELVQLYDATIHPYYGGGNKI